MVVIIVALTVLGISAMNGGDTASAVDAGAAPGRIRDLRGALAGQGLISVTSTGPLRLGVLGAARIAEIAIIGPAHATGARLVAVAARDRGRAESFAAQHGFERVLESYQEVLDDPEVEAVYNPLANGLHGPWNLRAIEAGKHVLTEKPFASNAEEARRVRDAAKAAGVHVVEAFHYAYHPLMVRMIELAGGDEIGDLQAVEARMLMPPPAAGDPGGLPRSREAA